MRIYLNRLIVTNVEGFSLIFVFQAERKLKIWEVFAFKS